MLNLIEKRKKKTIQAQCPRNMGHFEKTKFTNNEYRGRRRNPGRWCIKYFLNKIIEEKPPNLKENIPIKSWSWPEI